MSERYYKQGANFKPLAWVFDGPCIRVTSHAIHGMGYPTLWRNGKLRTVARMILERRHGLNNKAVSRHTCDNCWCVNPSHIISGTQAENARDMTDRKRSTIGERNPMSKLSSEDIIEIRKLAQQGIPRREIAIRFSVIKETIRDIVRRRTWNHLNS